jgi:hypothetical protein
MAIAGAGQQFVAAMLLVTARAVYRLDVAIVVQGGLVAGQARAIRCRAETMVPRQQSARGRERCSVALAAILAEHGVRRGQRPRLQVCVPAGPQGPRDVHHCQDPRCPGTAAQDSAKRPRPAHIVEFEGIGQGFWIIPGSHGEPRREEQIGRTATAL